MTAGTTIQDGDIVSREGHDRAMLVRTVSDDTAYCLWFEGTRLHHGTFLTEQLRSLGEKRRTWGEDEGSGEELVRFREVLNDGGLHTALAFLNARTPHRFTAVYRYDGEMLRSVVLFDRWQPEKRTGDDVPVRLAYCGIIKATHESLEVTDARRDPRFPELANGPVVSYCGVPIARPDGTLYGALCHWDLARCEVPSREIPLLFGVAPLIYSELAPDDQAIDRSERAMEAVSAMR